jgi:hypothetical protein
MIVSSIPVGAEIGPHGITYTFKISVDGATVQQQVHGGGTRDHIFGVEVQGSTDPLAAVSEFLTAYKGALENAPTPTELPGVSV